MVSYALFFFVRPKSQTLTPKDCNSYGQGRNINYCKMDTHCCRQTGVSRELQQNWNRSRLWRCAGCKTIPTADVYTAPSSSKRAIIRSSDYRVGRPKSPYYTCHPKRHGSVPWTTVLHSCKELFRSQNAPAKTNAYLANNGATSHYTRSQLRSSRNRDLPRRN